MGCGRASRNGIVLALPNIFSGLNALWVPPKLSPRRATRRMRHRTKSCEYYRPGDLLMAVGDVTLNASGDMALDNDGNVDLNCFCCGCAGCSDSTPDILTVTISGVSACPCVRKFGMSVQLVGNINFTVDVPRNTFFSRSCIWQTTDTTTNPNVDLASTIPTSQVALREYTTADNCTGAYIDHPLYIRIVKTVAPRFTISIATTAQSDGRISLAFFTQSSIVAPCTGTVTIPASGALCPTEYLAGSADVATGGSVDITA